MRFADITGQEDLKRHLTQSVDAGRVSHAQLFTGTAGSGALAVAVAYVQYLCCRHRSGGDSCGECPDCRQIAALAHPDLHLVFPVNKQGKKSGEVMRSDEFLPQFRALFAERGGYFSPQDWYDRLDLGKTLKGMIAAREADEIIRKLSFKSFEADYKTMLIWLPEAMNEEAANKILKILEEPWDRTLFILVCEHPDRLLPTIVSRRRSACRASRPTCWSGWRSSGAWPIRCKPATWRAWQAAICWNWAIWWRARAMRCARSISTFFAASCV